MKRVLLASIAVLTLAGTAFAEGPDYSSQAAAVATDSNYLNGSINVPTFGQVLKRADRLTTGSIGHGNPLGNYGPTVTPADLH